MQPWTGNARKFISGFAILGTLIGCEDSQHITALVPGSPVTSLSDGTGLNFTTLSTVEERSAGGIVTSRNLGSSSSTVIIQSGVAALSASSNSAPAVALDLAPPIGGSPSVTAANASRLFPEMAVSETNDRMLAPAKFARKHIFGGVTPSGVHLKVVELYGRAGGPPMVTQVYQNGVLTRITAYKWRHIKSGFVARASRDILYQDGRPTVKTYTKVANAQLAIAAPPHNAFGSFASLSVGCAKRVGRAIVNAALPASLQAQNQKLLNSFTYCTQQWENYAALTAITAGSLEVPLVALGSAYEAYQAYKSLVACADAHVNSVPQATDLTAAIDEDGGYNFVTDAEGPGFGNDLTNEATWDEDTGGNVADVSDAALDSWGGSWGTSTTVGGNEHSFCLAGADEYTCDEPPQDPV